MERKVIGTVVAFMAVLAFGLGTTANAVKVVGLSIEEAPDTAAIGSEVKILVDTDKDLTKAEAVDSLDVKLTIYDDTTTVVADKDDTTKVERVEYARYRWTFKLPPYKPYTNIDSIGAHLDDILAYQAYAKGTEGAAKTGGKKYYDFNRPTDDLYTGKSAVDSVRIEYVAGDTVLKIGDKIKAAMWVRGVVEDKVDGRPNYYYGDAKYSVIYFATDSTLSKGVVALTKEGPDDIDLTEITISDEFSAFETMTKVWAFGFIKDRAGNLSSTADPYSEKPHASADAKSLKYFYIDAKKPTLVDTTTYVKVDDKSFFNNTNNKFTVWVSEKVDTLTVKMGGSTSYWGFHDVGPGMISINAYNVTSGDSLVNGQWDYEVTATDYAGNEADPITGTVWYDGEAPTLTDVYPVDGDSLGGQARVWFTLSEVVDSLYIKYAGPTVADTAFKYPAAPCTTLSAQMIVVADSLADGDYSVTIWAWDRAHNEVTKTISNVHYRYDYGLPTIDIFKIAVSPNDSVDVGNEVSLTVTAWDTTADKKAPLYKGEGVIIKASSPYVAYSGDGVTDNGDGTATLDKEHWVLGSRTVKVKTEKAAEDGVTFTVIDSTAEAVYKGETTLYFFPTVFAKYVVSAPETVTVNQEFQLVVTPTDKYGNPSMKKEAGVYKQPYSDLWLAFSANVPGVVLPAPQRITPVSVDTPQVSAYVAPDTFLVTPTVATSNLVVTVRTTDIAGNMGPEWGSSNKIVVVTAAPPPVAELDAPDSVWVEPLGGQGTFVRVSWILSDDNPGLGGNDKAVEYAIAAYDLSGNLKYQAVVPALYFPANVPPTNIGTVVFYTWEDTDSLRYYVWAQNRGIPLASAAYSVPKKAYKKLADGSVLVIPEKVAGAAKSTPVMRSAAAVSEPVAAYD
ncbi:MAG: hypothetical protein DRN95_05695, partial [Candidatus Hydrothermarchaeota archaeon]